MNVASLDSWAIKAQALDKLALDGNISRRQRRDLDGAIANLQTMLRQRSGKIIRQKYMSDMEDDCMQVCMVGILSAVRSFDPSRSSFSTHVHNQIRASIGDLKHKMKPESRNIVTLLPVQHVSLSTPIGGESGNFTIGDIIEDQSAYGNMLGELEAGMANLQIDRAYSQYLGRSEASSNGKFKTPASLRSYRLSKLREREVFVRHTLQGETLEKIATSYGVTRERVRQISAKIYADPYDAKEAGRVFKPGILNKYLASSHVSEECPDGYHEVWDEYVALAWTELGKDIRLTPTALDLSQIEVLPISMEFHPADLVGILPEPALDAVEVVIEDSSHETSSHEVDMVHSYVQAELPLFAASESKRPSLVRRLATIATTAVVAGSMATAAAAQESRAIPPEDFETGVSRIHKADVQQRRAPKTVRSSLDRTDLPVIDMAKIKLPQQAYGVMVASYSNPGTLRGSWPSVRSGWNMLRGLQPAGVSMKDGKYGLVFGPLNQGQAEGVCHEAKRKPRECAVTKFGGVTPQKSTASSKIKTESARS